MWACGSLCRNALSFVRMHLRCAIPDRELQINPENRVQSYAVASIRFDSQLTLATRRPMSSTTVSSFLSALRRSNLLTSEQMAAANSIGSDSDAVATARDLVKRGWLTEWQARQILAGKSKLFLGKYKLLDVLGQGGMGAVLKAESTTLGRPVALKVLTRGTSKSDVAEARFLREIRYAGRLNHPNIVRAIDADRVGERAFLVMEYVEGCDLKKVLKRDGAFGIDFACECVRQAATGLQHAHEAGMVHRDIKPSNLLLTKDPQTGGPVVKLLDLGLARFDQEKSTELSITQTGQIMGSPDYMAPEQAMNSRSADIRSDIYGLGVTLYQLLSDQLPFPGDNLMERLVARINQDAPPISSVRPDVPPVLVHIITRMLHRDPEQRFQTPVEVEAVLQSFVSSPRELQVKTVVAKPSGAESTLQAAADDTLNLFVGHLGTKASNAPISRRKSTVWPIAISIGVAVAIVGGVLYLLSQEEGPNTQKPRETAGVEQPETPAEEPETPVEEPAPTETSGLPLTPLPKWSSFTNPDIRVAHWALTTASRIRIQVGEETFALTSTADIPEGDFSVVSLDLHGLQTVNEEVLDHVTSATELRSLNLSGGAVTDEHLDQLSRLKYVATLDLSNTMVTSAGMLHLTTMLELSSLRLRYTEVSSDGLQSLAELPQLTRLDLEGTNVTDEIADMTSGLDGLTELNLKHTRVTSEAVARIRAQLPDCEVLF